MAEAVPAPVVRLTRDMDWHLTLYRHRIESYVRFLDLVLRTRLDGPPTIFRYAVEYLSGSSFFMNLDELPAHSIGTARNTLNMHKRTIKRTLLRLGGHTPILDKNIADMHSICEEILRKLRRHRLCIGPRNLAQMRVIDEKYIAAAESIYRFISAIPPVLIRILEHPATIHTPITDWKSLFNFIDDKLKNAGDAAILELNDISNSIEVPHNTKSKCAIMGGVRRKTRRGRKG